MDQVVSEEKIESIIQEITSDPMEMDAWAARWNEGKIQLILFIRNKGMVRFTADKTFIKVLVRDLTETLNNGDATHELEHPDLARPFVLPRSEALDLRHHLIKMLEFGPGGTPHTGYGSPQLELSRESLVQVSTPQIGRWV